MIVLKKLSCFFSTIKSNSLEWIVGQFSCAMQTFTCSKSTIEKLEKSVKYVHN